MDILQSFIRNGVLIAEVTELDELGRSVGGTIILQAPLSAELEAAHTAQLSKMIAAQERVITEAKANVAAGRPVTKLIATAEDVANAD